MAVVPGDRADEFHSLVLGPGAFSAGDAKQHGEREGVVHQGQRAVAAREQLPDGDVEELGENRAEFRRAKEATVVARIRPGGVAEVPGAREREQIIREIELLGRRLAARHVE